MNSTKILMLTALAALSLGVGSAMAQSEGASMPTIDYWTAKATVAQEQAKIAAPDVVQAGPSDADATQLRTPVNIDFSTLANPG